MKKIITLLCLVLISLGLFQIQTSYGVNCDFWDDTLLREMQDCLEWWNLVGADSSEIRSDWKIEGEVKNRVIYWTAQLATFLSLIAIGAVVYGAGLMTVSMWDDEKIKKWKDVIKWSILWFLWLLLAWALVRIVIELMFSVAN